VMDADKIVTATFAINVYTIVASAGPDGSVSPSGNIPVNHGSSRTFTITPSPLYLIQDVLVDGMSVRPTGSYTFLNVTTSHTIHATFMPLPDFLPPTIDLPKFGTFGGVTGWSDGPVQLFYVRSTPFPLQFTLADDGGWVKWTITVNSVVIMDPVGIGLIDYSLPLTEGRNDVVITAVDSAGNWATQEVIIYLDSRAPSLSVSTMPASVLSSTLFISGSVTDAVSGLRSLSINGESVTTFLDGSFSEKVILRKGVNDVVVVAMDKAGNTTSQVFTVKYGGTSSTGPSSIYLVLTIGKAEMEVNGMPSALDAAPFIKDSRTLLPIRALIEALGGTVQWNPSTKTATVALGSRTVALTIGSTIALVNGTPITLDVAPVIKNGRTFLPLRAVAENLGLDLAWEPVSQTIFLTYWP
jgi:hypothetical protein